MTNSPTPKTNKTSSPNSNFQSEQVATISAGHFVHDAFSAFIAPLLPILQDRLGTNYAMTGSLAMFTQLPSLLNPFIGYLADRVSVRYFVIFAPALTATLICMLGLSSSYTTLSIILLIIGVSIGSFHAPAPAMIGRLAGNQVGKGMSWYMAGGELGRTVGPLLVIAGIEWFSLEGLWRLALIGWTTSVFLFFRLKDVSAQPQIKGAKLLPWQQARHVFPALVLMMFSRGLLLVAVSIYLPLYMTDVKLSSIALAAASLAILELAGVFGALFAGTLSDTFGRMSVLYIFFLAAPIFYLLFLFAPPWALVPLLLIIGFTSLAPAPVQLAIVQDNFVDNRALANGTFVAMNFLIRALAIFLVGVLADRVGLQQTFLISGMLAFVALLAIPMLPKTTTT